MTDFPGTKITRLVLPLPEDTREALAEQEIEAPEHVALHLREATNRERQRFEMGQKAATDTQEWITDLLMRRAEAGTDRRVVRELLNDMQPNVIASLTYAYILGELPDPKVLGRMVTQTLSGTINTLLQSLAPEPSPSLPTSTASSPGTSSG